MLRSSVHSGDCASGQGVSSPTFLANKGPGFYTMLCLTWDPWRHHGRVTCSKFERAS